MLVRHRSFRPSLTLLVQSHSPLCSFICKVKSDQNLRPLH